jgi:hypothetical protein
VINTAPSWRQVKLMWDEIRLARNQSRIAFPGANATALRISETNYIQGISTNEAVKFQGIHGRNVLILADEAPGIRADIWDAIEGVRAGGDVHVLMLGNPVIPSGYFFNAFGRGRTVWTTFTIGAFDTPNLAGLTLEQLMEMKENELPRPALPYLITPRWVRERALSWGLKHPMFQARVLGQFPTQSEFAVFSLELIERAKRDPTDAEAQKAKQLPIQVGIAKTKPYWWLAPEEWSWVFTFFRKLTPEDGSCDCSGNWRPPVDWAISSSIRWASATTLRSTLPTKGSTFTCLTQAIEPSMRSASPTRRPNLTGVCANGWSGEPSADLMIWKRRPSSPPCSTGRPRPAEPRLRAKRKAENADKHPRIAPKPWSWRSGG